MNDKDIVIDITRNLNYKQHAEQFEIPILDNFIVETSDNPQMVFSATDKVFTEQLVSDGTLETNETFDQRINLVVKNTVDFMKHFSVSNSDKSLFYYRDYSNGTFNYKIYVQDFIIDMNGNTKIIRQLNAYFIEPRFNDFYQITIAAPALSMPTETLKIGIIDLVNDSITQKLYQMLKVMMDNLKYKNINFTENKNSKKEIESDVMIEENNKYTDEEIVTVINNEYDYSNIIPTIECITYLVQYCGSVFKQFNSLIEEDEKRNEQFKIEYKNYNYKKSYGSRFEIYIREKSYNNITCKDIESFQSAVNDGNVKNINSLDIKLELNYERGQYHNLVEHENSFSIIFKPYEIKFARKSNHNENDMNQIENNINQILRQFPASNSIFCTK